MNVVRSEKKRAATMSKAVLGWKRFDSFREARKAFRGKSCIYAMTDREEIQVLRIGESDNLWVRYNGGYSYMVEAAMHGSGNLVFVAEAPSDPNERKKIEAVLIYKYQPPYCVHHKGYCFDELDIEHQGDIPKVMVGQA